MSPALASVPGLDPAPRARSIQGEALNARRDHLYADQGYVDQVARRVSDGVALCRERFRHRYPPLPRRAPFDGHTVSGYLIRRTDPCLDCGCAYQVQRYEPYQVGKGRTREVRVRPAYNTTEYIKNALGEDYVDHGHGFIRPRDFRDSLATMAVNADPDAQAAAVVALETRTDWVAKHPRPS